MLKVGDTIYKFDINSRTYRRDENGRGIGGPIYEEHFVSHEIKGETKQSWLTGYNNEIKVNKKTLRSAGQSGFGGFQWYTEQTKEETLWKKEHRPQIERALWTATVDQLKEIAAIIGYTVNAEDGKSPCAD